MEDRFDTLAKSLNDGVTRRGALQRLGSGIAAGVSFVLRKPI